MNKYEIVTPDSRYNILADFFVQCDPSQLLLFRFYKGDDIETGELVGVVKDNVTSIHLAELSLDDEREDQPKEAREDTFGKLG